MKTTPLQGITAVVGLCLIAGCSTLTPQPPWKLAVAGDGPGELDRIVLDEPAVSNLPKSAYGNPSTYEVFGRQYAVMDSAVNFSQRGTASWYGKKFHGRATSSGEIYDMHLLSAAHKHLPLPTFVRVTRQDTGQSVVVKVNDRGPFVGDRIIDLSYAAAARLDMLESGKAEVLIEALSSHEPVQTALTEDPLVSSAGSEGSAVATDTRVGPAAQAPVVPVEAGPAEAGVKSSDLFLQVGAYVDEHNAQEMLTSLDGLLNAPTRIRADASGALHRVQVGPLSDGQQLARAQASLTRAGIASFAVRD